MFEYQDKVVQDVAACTCDRCQRRMMTDDFEWQEKCSVSFHGGYGSIFGDGNKVEIDLCPQCVKETLGAWLRISQSEWGDLIERGIDDSDAGQGYPADSAQLRERLGSSRSVLPFQSVEHLIAGLTVTLPDSRNFSSSAASSTGKATSMPCDGTMKSARNDTGRVNTARLARLA